MILHLPVFIPYFVSGDGCLTAGTPVYDLFVFVEEAFFACLFYAIPDAFHVFAVKFFVAQMAIALGNSDVLMPS